MVILIETNFYRHNREHFLFLVQMDDVSAAWEVPWVWQTRVLLSGGILILFVLLFVQHNGVFNWWSLHR